MEVSNPTASLSLSFFYIPWYAPAYVLRFPVSDGLLRRHKSLSSSALRHACLHDLSAATAFARRFVEQTTASDCTVHTSRRSSLIPIVWSCPTRHWLHNPLPEGVLRFTAPCTRSGESEKEGSAFFTTLLSLTFSRHFLLPVSRQRYTLYNYCFHGVSDHCTAAIRASGRREIAPKSGRRRSSSCKVFSKFFANDGSLFSGFARCRAASHGLSPTVSHGASDE
jgi:hypothetical protein